MTVEFGLKVSTDNKTIELPENITKCPLFKEDSKFVKVVLENIIDEKKRQRNNKKKNWNNYLEEKILADERAFELEKVKLSCENHESITASTNKSDSTLLAGLIWRKFYRTLIQKGIVWVCILILYCLKDKRIN